MDSRPPLPGGPSGSASLSQSVSGVDPSRTQHASRCTRLSDSHCAASYNPTSVAILAPRLSMTGTLGGVDINFAGHSKVHAVGHRLVVEMRISSRNCARAMPAQDKGFFTCTSHSGIRGSVPAETRSSCSSCLFHEASTPLETGQVQQPWEDPLAGCRGLGRAANGVPLYFAVQKSPFIQQKQRIQHEQETPRRTHRQFSLRSLSAQGCALIFGRIRRRLGVSMFKLSVGFQPRSLSPEGLLPSQPVQTCEGWKQLALALLTLWLCMHLNISTFRSYFLPTHQVRLFSVANEESRCFQGLHTYIASGTCQFLEVSSSWGKRAFCRAIAGCYV